MIRHGFELVRQQRIEELRTMACLYRHVKTGAEVLSLENDDENKVFGIAFRTPPSDSTGVAHILEHSVLGGSRKYPVKDPFLQMAKGSLKTFINAFTGADRTVYPVASQNAQDFQNLMDVYLDAVFFPRISPQTLAQEGWHFELTDAEGPLVYRGIVFNEMKGVYSSPEGALARYARRALFPDTTYGHDSGGDPRHIPDLTYEQFRSFYEQFYNPANARIVLYGDHDADSCLRHIDEFIGAIEPRTVDSSVALQPRFEAPRHVDYPYDAGMDVSTQKRGIVSLLWLIGEVTDPVEAMAWDVISHILVGTPAAPLRKALIDSGLGDELIASGLGSQQLEWIFGIGLKNIALADAERVETLALQTLEQIAGQPLDPNLVEAALNTLEFALRERNTGAFPRGIAMMMGALRRWLYGGDPIEALSFEAPLAALKARLSTGDRLLETTIGTHLARNLHRVTLVLRPQEGLSAREETDEKARLAAIHAGLSPAGIDEILAETAELKRLQEEPDTPEALATLPMLKRGDLERNNKHLPLARKEWAGAPVFYHDLFTSGIVYVDLGFNLRALQPDLLPYLSLFGRALLEMGTSREDFTQLALRIGRETGGVGRASLVDLARNGEPLAWFFLRGKSTVPQAGELAAILRDVLLDARFDNVDRFRQMVMQERARQEASLLPAGNAIAAQRLRAHFNPADRAGELMGGVSYLFAVRELAQALEHDWAGVLRKLESIRAAIVRRGNLLLNVTVDADNLPAVRSALEPLIEAMPEGKPEPVEWTIDPAPINEGLTIPSKVNFVTKGANIYAHGFTTRGSASVATALLSRNFVHERVRVQGGAYGGGCSFDRHTGLFVFTSYRDPNVLETVRAYDEAANFLRTAPLSDDELTKHIVGVIGQLDAYMLPDTKGYASMVRTLSGDTEEYLQQRREEVLETTARDVREFADVVEAVARHGVVVALGSPEAIESANAAGAAMQVTKVL